MSVVATCVHLSGIASEGMASFWPKLEEAAHEAKA